MKGLKKYLSFEIGIEFKACLYFCMILFFYFLYRIIGGSYYASIIRMAEMVLITYMMGYIQVFLLQNFDESDCFGVKEGVFALCCSAFYTSAGYLLRWYDRNIAATAGFFFYMLFCYGCVFLIYKIKREAETIKLNRELEIFKSRKGRGEECDE